MLHYPRGIFSTRKTKEEITQEGSSAVEQLHVNLSKKECHQATLLPGLFFFPFGFVASNACLKYFLCENEMHLTPESA